MSLGFVYSTTGHFVSFVFLLCQSGGTRLRVLYINNNNNKKIINKWIYKYFKPVFPSCKYTHEYENNKGPRNIWTMSENIPTSLLTNLHRVTVKSRVQCEWKWISGVNLVKQYLRANTYRFASIFESVSFVGVTVVLSRFHSLVWLWCFYST